MYTNGNIQKLPIETRRIVYMKRLIELEIILKEEENGWITVIPIFNGKQAPSFCIVNVESAIKEIRNRYNIEEELTIDDFIVKVESTNFEGSDT